MFWTAFIWGLGVSCGACFGLLLFLVLKIGLDWLTETKAVKTAREATELSIAALQKRNELTVEQNHMLERMAVVFEQQGRSL